MGYAFSAKAAKKANTRLAALRGTRSQKSRMAEFDAGKEDYDGDVRDIRPGKVNSRHNNDERFQGGRAEHGRRVSRDGDAGRERQMRDPSIDAPQNRKKFPAGDDAEASHARGANTRQRGKIAPQGGQYGGGSQRTQ